MPKAYVFLADGVEETEAITVIDYLRRAGIDTLTLSMSNQKMITGSHAIKVEADRLFKEVNLAGADILVLPGGPGYQTLLKTESLLELIRQYHQNGKKLAAICAAPSVLGAAGVLTGKKFTCFPGYEQKCTGGVLQNQAKRVIDGNIITGKGPGTAVDFSLSVIEALLGKAKSQEIATSTCFEE